MDGLVFDIKRFTIHDGPGIRSTIFTKGCVLRCPWCQNPEGRITGINLWYFENKCLRCHKCMAVCPSKALSFGNEGENHISVNQINCTNCAKCVDVCPSKALVFDGRIMSSDEVMKEILKDKIFYETSGGGITISGGDPLVQYEFNLEILQKCRENGIHTAIETCLHIKTDIFERFLELTDYFIVDLKVFDPVRHEKYIGVGNDLIKRNFEMLVSKGVDILVRIPLIPGYTADEDNIRSIAGYIHNSNSDIPIELINFNPLARNKYRLMNREYLPDGNAQPFSADDLESFKDILKKEGISRIVQG